MYRLLFRIVHKLRLTNLLSDELYIRFAFRALMGEKLDLRNPKTFNQKLQWLKLYNRKDLYTRLVDKYEVKGWVEDKIGSEYLIPTIGVWDSVSDIDWDILPQQFVLKATHYGDNLGVIVCKDKDHFDRDKAIENLSQAMKKDYYLRGREWPYKNVVRKIIAEEYIEDEKSGELSDYKFFCFDGKVKALYIATERASGDAKFDFFDESFNHLNFYQSHKLSAITPKKPETLEKMIALAEKLSAGMPFVRVDLYEANGRNYFGEMTFFHLSGLAPFHPKEWDYKFGEMIKLPPKEVK